MNVYRHRYVYVGGGGNRALFFLDASKKMQRKRENYWRGAVPKICFSDPKSRCTGAAFLFAVFLLCVLRDFLCLTPAMGCAHMDDHCAKSDVQCASMACGWCVAQTKSDFEPPTKKKGEAQGGREK